MQLFTHRKVAGQHVEGSPALLLEGAWSDHSSSNDHSRDRWSLDDWVDSRFGWIDREASRIAESLASPPRFAASSVRVSPQQAASELAWIHALRLRYYLVKLLRIVAFFESWPKAAELRGLSLIGLAGRDDDYAALLTEICRHRGWQLEIHWQGHAEERPTHAAPNALWRRAAGAVVSRTADRIPSAGPGDLPLACGEPRRVILCGNPAKLDLVCDELLTEGHRPCWLFDRFAVRTHLRWRERQVPQLLCNSSQGRRDRFEELALSDSVMSHGVSLRESIEVWLRKRAAEEGCRLTRLVEAVDAHFRRVRPDVVLLDEDATPLARCVVAAARQWNTRSVVVQHGAPYVRFGFAPLAADDCFVWGKASRRQLLEWQVPVQRIHVTGPPWEPANSDSHSPVGPRENPWAWQRPAGRGHDALRVLILLTVPPRSERPDAVSLHLTGRTYRELIENVLAAVSHVVAAEVFIRPHPRAIDDPILRHAMQRFALPNVRIAARGSLDHWLAQCDCVISCVSSAGIEAAAAGLPVIQLLPAGAADLLSDGQWGFLDTARTCAELIRLLERARMHQSKTGPCSALRQNHIFAQTGRAAARSIVNRLFEISSRHAHWDTHRPFVTEPIADTLRA